ncbi:MAG TPA: YIP1 family protein [Dehalococcoidia bacterium]|nr:YIP1 family protein [Dehalococcoidia bacterium]
MAVDPQTILGWLRRLARLDTSVFDDIRGNPTSTIPAVIVVSVAILLSGIGGWLWWMVKDLPESGDVLLKSAVIGSLLAIAIWHIVWLGIVYILLTQFFRERVFLEQLLRVMGVSMSPLALGVLMWVPEISFAIGIATLVLAFGLSVIAIQRVTTADAARVLVSSFAGFVVWASVLTLLASSTNQYAPGVFLFDVPAETAADLFEARDLVGD